MLCSYKQRCSKTQFFLNKIVSIFSYLISINLGSPSPPGPAFTHTAQTSGLEVPTWHFSDRACAFMDKLGNQLFLLEGKMCFLSTLNCFHSTVPLPAFFLFGVTLSLLAPTLLLPHSSGSETTELGEMTRGRSWKGLGV